MRLAALALAVPLLTPLAAGAQKGGKETGFAGEWMTSFGPMTLRVKGKNVAGHYGWAEEGEVEGTLAKDRVELEWRGPNGRGEGWLALWDDRATVVGESTGPNGKAFLGGYRRAPLRAEPKPGQVTDGQTESGLEYHLRLPEKLDRKRRYTALALFHGSNANSREYVEGFPGNWPELADEYVLVGFDGERLSAGSRDGRRVFNATYVEFSGHRVGEPWRWNQTPWLVAQALEQLEKELPIERWYVSGHSQGGFLTLAVAMFYPERIAGAIEVAGNLLVQCEPDFFTDEKLKAAQRRVPIALVHGRKDTVVEFSAAAYTFDALDDGGFPMLRLFAPPELGHPWAFLPLDEALAWLDGLNRPDAEGLLEFAAASIEQEQWRDACAALVRAQPLARDPALRARRDELAARIDAAAAAAAEPVAKALAADDGNEWVDAFWDFRARFGLSPAAAGVLRDYSKLREKHQRPATERFERARQLQSDEQKQELYREIVEEFYASRWYRLVKGWVK